MRNNEGDVSGVNVKDSQTMIKSETVEQIVRNRNGHRKVYCQECGKPMWSNNISRHKQTCQVLRNRKKNEGDASSVDIQANLPQKIADAVMEGAQSAGSKKRKADCLEESKDIPTFEQPGFSGLKSLSDETLVRMMEISDENRARILKLEKRLYGNKKVNCQECGKAYASRQSFWNHKQKCQAMRKKNKQAGILPTTILTTKQSSDDFEIVLD